MRFELWILVKNIDSPRDARPLTHGFLRLLAVS
jgi:hypothetical protein